MSFTKDDARNYVTMMRTGYLGDKVYDAFLVLSGRQAFVKEIPPEAIETLVRLELGEIVTPTFMFSREGGQLKNEAPTPVFILTNKGKKVARQIYTESHKRKET